MSLWEIDIYPAEGHVDRAGEEITSDAIDLGLAPSIKVAAVHGYLLEGSIDADEASLLANKLLADSIVEKTVVAPVGAPLLNEAPVDGAILVHVINKPGVMDPVAMSAQQGISDLGIGGEQVRTFRKYWVPGVDEASVHRLAEKVLANDAIELAVHGPLQLEALTMGAASEFELKTIPIRDLDDDGLELLSKDGQLYLTLIEMQTIQQHFQQLDRDPTDIELESVAQTWSEHCSHKTLAGRIAYKDGETERHFENMLKETVFAATVKIREELGAEDWCVSVFKDNAGIVTFDDDFNVAFKVETHNHPSALEPYGGANTGIGGVIRDTLGTGLGAKPICNTDLSVSPNTFSHYHLVYEQH